MMRFVVSLVTSDNDYQVAQAIAAQEAASRLEIDLSIQYAESDGINQSQQLLKIIQGPKELLPDGIIVQPAGTTALPHVARAAVAAGITWVVLNREVDYLAELRRSPRTPCFSISSDHREIGRIQSEQIRALLPGGGLVLLIQGPASTTAASLRLKGLLASKPSNLRFITRTCSEWTQAGGYKTIVTWLTMPTSHTEPVQIVAAQNDSLAMGARKAFSELPEAERERWLQLPFLGVDGLPKTGAQWVREGLLRATVFVPTNAARAVEMLADALRRRTPVPEITMVPPVSLPDVQTLRAQAGSKSHSAGL